MQCPIDRVKVPCVFVLNIHKSKGNFLHAHGAAAVAAKAALAGNLLCRLPGYGPCVPSVSESRRAGELNLRAAAPAAAELISRPDAAWTHALRVPVMPHRGDGLGTLCAADCAGQLPNALRVTRRLGEYFPGVPVMAKSSAGICKRKANGQRAVTAQAA